MATTHRVLAFTRLVEMLSPDVDRGRTAHVQGVHTVVEAQQTSFEPLSWRERGMNRRRLGGETMLTLRSLPLQPCDGIAVRESLVCCVICVKSIPYQTEYPSTLCTTPLRRPHSNGSQRCPLPAWRALHQQTGYSK